MADLKGVTKLEASERAASPYIHYRRYNESFDNDSTTHYDELCYLKSASCQSSIVITRPLLWMSVAY